jgi:hypothetical protein
VNLEYLARVVFNNGGILYPDSVVGTDSHTTMVDGLGVAGWGVGGIEAEAAMLGQVKYILISKKSGSDTVEHLFSLQQQQQNLLSQASWGRLEFKTQQNLQVKV